MKYLSLIVLFFSSCSPLYVIRAGWEEAGILLNRQKISQVINSSEDPQIKSKLRLVLEAREFSKQISLRPKHSFTYFSQIDRDVLVWVLSASAKTSLTPKTWWFPILGTVPYKGFFDKNEGIALAKKLNSKGKDVYLRPSAAFSTLGWFNDPVLSTMIKFDDVDLVNTVIHEILHNTIWVKNNAFFNETLANFVGAKGAEQFFIEKYGAEDPRVNQAKNDWTDTLIFAHFLENLTIELNQIYKLSSKTEILNLREQAFSQAKEYWRSHQNQLKTKHFVNIGLILNNAVIIANQIYLTKPWVFEELLNKCNNSLPSFIAKVQKVIKTIDTNQLNPFLELEKLDSCNL